jgi:flagellar motor switch/type III secretory pathway protein FliN
MGASTDDNPLVGRFDDRTRGLLIELLGQAARRQRLRLVNRVGTDVPIRVGETRYEPLGRLQDRMREEQLRLLARIRLLPVGLPGLVALDLPLLYRITGLLLGEDPWAEPTPADPRPLTKADLRLGAHLVADLADGLSDVLPGDRAQRLVVDEVSDDPRLDVGLPLSSGMLGATLDFGDPESPMGLALVALPTAVVPALWPDVKPPDLPGREGGVDRVLPLRVEAVAELARLRLPLSKVRALEVGEVLELGALRHVEVRVRGRQALVGEAGSRDGIRCIRVIRNVHDAA